MSETSATIKRLPWPRISWALILLAVIMVSGLYPQASLETGGYILDSMLSIAPLVIPGILISAWVTASGAGGRIARVFEGNLFRTVLVSSAIGAITPVCGVTVLPLMAGLLASGVPFAPIMAFWLSSPVTDPAMLATTIATLGWKFAIGKTVAAFGLGMLGGMVTAGFSTRPWAESPLRQSQFVASLGGQSCCAPQTFNATIWSDAERRKHFIKELVSMTRLIVICLVPAFMAEHLLNQFLHPEALVEYIGQDAWWAVPFAVFVGAPAYIDGYAALPLTRGLIEHGMSQGAAMAFLVSGGVVSIWGAMAIFPVLKFKPFFLFLTLAVVGSLCAGWLYSMVT